MKKAVEPANDDEPFVSIGLHALLILNKLQNSSRLSRAEVKPEIDHALQEVEQKDQQTEERRHEAARHALA